MCAHIHANFQAAAAAELLHAKLDARGWVPSPHVVPTQPLLALRRATEGRVLESLHWGLIPSWAHDMKIGAKTFNARADSLDEKPSFRPAFRARRCALLVSGFYEWATVDGKRVPYLFSVPGHAIFCLAGLYETWRPSQGGAEVHSCTIITTAANAQTLPIHDRMPVILGTEVLDRWLDPATPHDALPGLLVPFALPMTIEHATIAAKH